MEQSKWATPSPTAQAKANPLPPPPAEPVAAPQSADTNPPPAASKNGTQTASILTSEPTPFPLSSYPNPSGSAYALDGSAEEFSQTRPPDDLFSDDFEPVEEHVAEEPAAPTAPKIPTQRRNARRAPRQNNPPSQPRAQATTAEGQTAGAEAPRKEAVRGDRSGTGGVKKTKLTEEELSQRMEAIKLKNQTLEAAHARAEADEASFQQREADAQVKRRQERQNRQQMMGEREKNRLRKMNALGGREWDADKDDEALAGPSRGSQYRRGAHGGVAMDARPAAVDGEAAADQGVDGDGSYRGRGRGGGRGRGRGRGRGGAGGGVDSSRGGAAAAIRDQTVPTTSDFPSLPTTSKPQAAQPATDGAAALQEKSTVDTASPVVMNSKSWAEEMESSPAPPVGT